MNLLAIVGSPRKGKATDTLVDKAIDGVKSKAPDYNVKKLIVKNLYLSPKTSLRLHLFGEPLLFLI